MCYYNGQKVTRAEYIRLKDLELQLAEYEYLAHDLQIGFDYGKNAVIRAVPGKQEMEMVHMEWGFIPHYIRNRESLQKMRFGYKDANGKFHPPITTLNATSEEMFTPGKIYRDAAFHRRCLVVSSGFFEWRHIYPLNKRTGQPVKTPLKYPYYITVKDSEYFFMAGLWQPWTDKDTGEHVESFAIVTTKANSLMEQIHNSKKRMPTILNEDLAHEWLFGDLTEERIKEIGQYQFSSGQMQACTIAKDFREALEPTRGMSYEDVPAIVE